MTFNSQDDHKISHVLEHSKHKTKPKKNQILSDSIKALMIRWEEIPKKILNDHENSAKKLQFTFYFYFFSFIPIGFWISFERLSHEWNFFLAVDFWKKKC